MLFLRLKGSLPLALLLVGALAFACRKENPAPEPEQDLEKILALKPIASAPPRASVAPLVASAVVEIRERLSLAAPAPRLRQLAFGKGFVVQLTANAVRAYSTRDGKVLFEAPLKAPRAALSLPGGSVLIADLDASYRLDPGQRSLHRRTRLSLLPGSLLEPSRESLEFAWVLEPWRTSVVRYALSPDAGIGIEKEQQLPEFDGAAFTTLRDGSFLYTAGQRLGHAASGSKPRFAALPAQLDRPWRLLAGDRIDNTWAVTAGGDFVLLELGVRARSVRSFKTHRLPIDVAVSPTRLALVSVVEEPRAGRAFELTVYAADGRELFSRPVGKAPASVAGDWAASALRDQQLILGGDPARVAVGGPGVLRIFDLESGSEI